MRPARCRISFPVLLAALLAAALPAGPARAGANTWTTGGPPGRPIRDLVVEPGSDVIVWAATDTGVYRTPNGGITWTNISTGLTIASSNRLAIASPGNLYCGTAGAGVFRFDGSSTWLPVNTGLPLNATIQALATNGSTVVAATPSALFRSLDDGQTWDQVALANGTTRIVIQPLDATRMYATAPGGLLVSNDSGATWGVVTTGLDGQGTAAIALHPTDPSVVFVGRRGGAAGGGIYKSTDAGQSFAPLSIVGITPTSLVADPATPATMYYSTAGTVSQSIDGGVTWNSMNAGLGAVVTNVLAIDSTGVFLHLGTATTSDTGNGVWDFAIAASPLPTLTSISPTTKAQRSGKFVLTVTGTGFSGRSVVTWNGLARETTLISDTTLQARVHGEDLVDPGIGSVQVRTLPPGGGTSAPISFTVTPNPGVWTTNGPLTSQMTVFGIARGPAGSRRVYSATEDGLFRSMYDATDWTQELAGPFNCVFQLPSSDKVYAGANGSGVYVSETGEGGWVPLNAGLTTTAARTVYALALSPTSTLYAGTEAGVYRLLNGTTWQFVAPRATHGLLILPPVVGGDRIFAATPIGLYRSTDGGASFSLVLGGTSVNAVVLSPFAEPGPNPAIYAGTDDFGLWRTIDFGDTWARIDSYPRPSVRSIALDPTTANKIYVGEGTLVTPGGIGTVYRTTDAGTTWAPYNNQLPSSKIFALAVKEDGSLLHAGLFFRGQWDILTADSGPPADLSVTVTGAPDPVNVADLVTYTITATNNGPNGALNAVVTDTFPPGAMLIFANASQGSCTGTTSVSCAIGSLGAGASVTVTVQVRALQAGSLVNSAAISSNAADPDPSNNQAVSTVTVNGGTTADLTLTLTDAPDPAGIGSSVTYTIGVRNDGPSTAPNVTVEDVVSNTMTLLTATPSQGSCVGSTCLLGTLASGATATVSVVAKANQAGTIPNHASVFSSASDPNPLGNVADVTTRVAAPGSDLSISMTDAPDPVVPGADLTYSITVSNAGIDPGIAVKVTDTLPPGVTFVSASASSGSCTGTSTVTCNLLDMPVDSTRTVTLVVRPGGPGTLSNTATVSSTSPDPDGSNNSASTTTQVNNPPAGSADLSVAMTAAPDPLGLGSVLTYTITASNGGPSTATGVTVADTLPPGAAFVSVVASQGSCGGAGLVTCSLGSLLPGSSATVTLKVKPSAAGSVTNQVQISGAQTDAVPGNNTASVTTTVIDAPDLVLTMVDAPDPVVIGGTLTYSFTVRNAGSVTGTAVTLTDVLPAGVTPGTATPSQGTCGGLPNLSCNLGTLLPGASATVTLTVTPTVSGFLVNTASVAAAESDVNPADNAAFTRTTVNGTPSDLFLLKSHSGNFTAGTNGTFTLTVTNVGAGASAPAGPIKLGSIANARFGSDWTLNGPQMANTRAKLLDPANFGPAGRVGRAVTIDDTAQGPGSVTPLLLSAYDAFFVGYLQDAATNAFTDAELAAFRSYAEDGGTLIVTCDNFDHDNVCNALGYPVMATLRSEDPYTPVDGSHPAFNGPFGLVSTFGGSQTIGYFFDAEDLTVLARNPQGIPVLATKTYGQGRVVFLTDVDFLATRASAGSGINNANDQLIGNLFAWAAGAGVTTVTDTLPAGLSFVSGGGAGWTCSAVGPVVTCTGGAPLAPGASTSFTITVAVSGAAVPSVTNTATVSSPNDGNPANDTAIDTVAVGSTPIAIPVPSVNSVVPSSGPTAGGTSVTIYGSNFAAGATPKFNGSGAAVVTSTPTALAVVTPPGAVGPASVSVTNPDGGTFTRAGAFTYLPASSGATMFYTLSPCRVVDTRNPAGPLGGPVLAPGSTRSFLFAGTCGIPADAVALSTNVTVTGSTDSGFLKVYATGQAEPSISSINFGAGLTRANNGIFTLGSGALNVFAGTAGTVHVIVDVNGYFK